MSELDSNPGTTTREPITATPELYETERSRAESGLTQPDIKTATNTRLIRGWFWRSLVVVLEVGVAFVIRELVAHRHPGFAPFITFYPAILLGAILDGVWAGIAVTVLSTFIAQVWIFAPMGGLAVSDPYEIASLMIFFVFGISLSIVVEMYHRNREKLAAYLVEQAVSQERRRQDEERKVAESIRAEQQRLFDVMEALPAMISLRRTDHLISFANRSFREKFGEPGGRYCYETRFGRKEPCEDCETFIPLKTGKPHHREVTFPDSSLIDAYDFPFHDVDGSSAILEMGIDITDRRRAETELKKHREHLEELVAERTRQLEAVNARLEAEIRELEQAQHRLSESRAKLEAALSSMTDSVIITDTAGNFVEFNDAYATLYRFKNKAECTRSFAEFSELFEVSTADGEPLTKEMFPTWRALRGETQSNVEYSYRRKDTGETWIGSLSFSPVRAEDGSITGAVITARDVTERKRTEEALRRSEKMALQREQFQALAERLRRAREEERTRVSRDLHDQIGQILTAIKLDLTWMTRRLPKANEEFRDRLRGTIGLINDGVRSVRKICTGLRPGVLDDLGLAAAIEWQANEFASRTGIHCDISVPTADVVLDGDQATEFFRIFQECLTNVMRHAEAKSVRVSLCQEHGALVLMVADDGKGFCESEVSNSLGFLGMKERAQVCGGTIQIVSSPGNGTTVTLRVPMQPAEASEGDYAHSDRR
jgi:PAS domain S-box-containing protein